MYVLDNIIQNFNYLKNSVLKPYPEPVPDTAFSSVDWIVFNIHPPPPPPIRFPSVLAPRLGSNRNANDELRMHFHAELHRI